MPALSRDVCLGVVTCFLLASSTSGVSNQTRVEEKHKLNHDIRRAIQAEHRQWNRNTETIISGTIENLTDGPLDLNVDPAFYLSSRTTSEMADKFWAPADVLNDRPIGLEKADVGGAAVSIEPRSIHLQFKNGGDKVDFRVDAQQLLWAEEISSVWPHSGLFSTVKSDEYDLQLVMETDNGRVESPKVKISIDASRPPQR
jgi:hypothetical protein